jgi:hypothetical protein
MAPASGRGLTTIPPLAAPVRLSSAADYGRLRGRLAPDVLERFGRHRGVSDGIGDRGVAKEVLKSARVYPPIGQGVTGRVAQHVNVNRKRQLGGFTSSLDHTGDSHAADVAMMLIIKHAFC